MPAPGEAVHLASSHAALDWALRYAERGWHVLPVAENKRPLGGHGVASATTDAETIRGWFESWPGAQVAIACKPSKLVVIDLDVGHGNGADGVASFAAFLGDRDSGAALIASTPRGGQHLYYAAPDGEEIRSPTGVLSGVDVRGGSGQHGTYIVAPCGRDDRGWCQGDPFTTRLAPPPGFLLELLRGTNKLGRTEPGHPTKSSPSITYKGGETDSQRRQIASTLFRIPPSVGRDEWLEAIFAVHDGLGGDSFGGRLVEAWSSLTDRPGQFQTGEAENIYSAAKPANGKPEGQLVSKRTLLALARRYDAATVFEPIASEAPLPNLFPVASFPRGLQTFVEECAHSQGVDVSYWAVPLLGILAGCIGATRNIQLKAEWIEPCVLWTAIIAPSGAGKSPPLRTLLKPVRDHDAELHRQYQAASALYESDRDEWKSHKGEHKPPKPVPPPMLAALVNDVTLEALVARLENNPRGLLLAVDELAAWLRSFDRYRAGGGDQQSWLSIHNADPVKVDRKGSQGSPQRIYVDNAAVSIVGTIQPTTAAQHLGSAENRGTGLAARLLLASPPISRAEWNDLDTNQDLRDGYERVVRALLRLDLHAGRPRTLTLEAEARDRFVAFHDNNGSATAEAGAAGNDDLAAALSKLRGAAPRIALVLALARAAEIGQAADLQTVDAEAMAGGIAIASYFEAEARQLYAAWQADRPSRNEVREHSGLTNDDVERKILQLLHGGEQTRSQLSAAFGRNVPSSRLEVVLALLQLQGTADCRKNESGRPGRPAEIWFLRSEGVSS